DALGELLNEGSRVKHLRDEMAGVKINAKAWAVANGIERFARAHKVVGDFGGMYLQAKLDPFLLKYINDWMPPPGKVLVALLDLRKVFGGEGIEFVPDGRAGKSINLLHPTSGGSASCIHHLLCRTLAHALGLTIAPDMGGQNVFVAAINGIADGLADE